MTERETRIATVSILAYLTVYCLESPIRWGLVSVGLVAFIVLRDLFLIVPLLIIGVRQLRERRLEPVISVFLFLCGMQAVVFYLNYHAIGPMVLGIKLLVNVLFGLVVGAAFLNASGRVLRYMAALFVLTCIGLFIEKFVTTFPWLGMSANVGGIEIAISHDWGAADELSRRVAGFTRESINAAGLVPFLAIFVATKVRHYLLRFAILALAVVSVFLTTQKGALLASTVVSLCLLMLPGWRIPLLRAMVLVGAALQITLPFVTNGMLIAEGTGGVFSASSFAARVLYTWPEALRYVHENAVGPFGLGLGGLGGPMRLLIPAAIWMFADNMFILLYAYFGVFVAVFYGTCVYAVWRSFRLSREASECGLAILAFVLWYGTVITGVEDQAISLALGLSLGCLLKAAPMALPAPKPARSPGSAVPA